MRYSAQWLAAAAVLGCTACLGEEGRLEIRSVNRGLSSAQEPLPYRIAEARGHLALGNVALALEGFRKAAREDPANVDALAGIADCYDRIGRVDLSRRYYEMALAVAPRDPALLTAFAASLQAQGHQDEAAAVRRELAALAPASPPQTSAPAVAEVEAAAAAAPAGASVTIALPPARAMGAAAPQAAAETALAVVPVGRSVTIPLPPARPAPAAAAPAKSAAIAPPPAQGPRLERLSPTEVALVTGKGPRWTRPSASPVPTRPAGPAVAEIRILNAARVDRLAARTRAFLGRYGWTQVVVGNAAAPRQQSLIVYPKDATAAARRLSARLGFAATPRDNVRQLTILLGRDAAQMPGLRRRA